LTYGFVSSYILAAELHGQLDDLSSSLTQLIDSVNAVSPEPSADAKLGTGEDTITQIAQVLSSHLESLQWIDSASRELESKVNEVEKEVRSAGIGQNAIAAAIPRPRSGFGVNR
jgi:nuclear pore complex protein Nup62